MDKPFLKEQVLSQKFLGFKKQFMRTSLMITSEKKRNTLIGLFAILIWSFAALLATELSALPAFELLTFQFSIAFSITCVRYFFSKKRESFFHFRIRDFIIAALALVLYQSCYFIAFQYAPSIEVDLINYLWPTFLLLFSSFLPKEKFHPSYLLSIFLCLWGIYQLLVQDPQQAPSFQYFQGEVLSFIAALSWAFYSLYTRYHKSNGANCLPLSCGLASLCSLCAHLLFEDFVVPSPYEGFLAFLFGCFLMGLSFHFWERALKKGDIKLLSLSCYITPPLSVLILIAFGKTDYTANVFIATLTISIAPLLPLFFESKILTHFLASFRFNRGV